MSKLELIGTVVGAIFGSNVLTTLINSWALRKKTIADADTATTDNALKWADALTRRIDKLEADLEGYRRENLELHKEVATLKAELTIYKSQKLPTTNTPK